MLPEMAVPAQLHLRHGPGTPPPVRDGPTESRLGIPPIAFPCYQMLNERRHGNARAGNDRRSPKNLGIAMENLITVHRRTLVIDRSLNTGRRS